MTNLLWILKIVLLSPILLLTLTSSAEPDRNLFRNLTRRKKAKTSTDGVDL